MSEACVWLCMLQILSQNYLPFNIFFGRSEGALLPCAKEHLIYLFSVISKFEVICQVDVITVFRL